MEYTLVPVTPEQSRQLKRYNTSIETMWRSRFIQQARSQKLRIEFSRPSLESTLQLTEHPDFDFEDLKSFLTTYRQIFILQDEPIYIYRIRNIISGLTRNDPTIQKDLKRLKNSLNNISSAQPMISLSRNADGKSVEGMPYELLEKLVNGEIFHSDKNLHDETEVLLGTEPWSYLTFVYAGVIGPMVQNAIWLAQTISELGLASFSLALPGNNREASEAES